MEAVRQDIMTRGHLGKSDLLKIDDALPSIAGLGELVLHISPEVVSISFPPESCVPVASVCLQDAYHTIAEARYAMHESLAHELWYRKRRKKPYEIAAVYFAKYYLDDAALRIYSSGEHLANAILRMMEIARTDLRSYKNGKVSLQVAVKKYLMAKNPEHPITQALDILVSSGEWNLARCYRNRLVHEQPPTVVGLGITHRREIRWIRSAEEKTWTLRFGGGDKPEYTVQQLQHTFRQALAQLIDFALSCSRFYLSVLNKKGIQSVNDR